MAASDSKLKKLKHTRQALGTLNKVIEMIEEGKYCPEIIQQIDSAIGLLKVAKRQVLAGHLDTCVADKMIENKEKTIAELLMIYNLSN
ncbi:metal-sensitive transcriptional regulator [Candidatus Gracilibacteria bacterium]|jgi:DNA-binding FrmR family transcriptional regulator|nr:metal-sensitive transcriptional regulator [Candidatus Gracilibacteria bacterium]